jgi:hypothetical protein
VIVSLPQLKAVFAPARHAYSHSASVGRLAASPGNSFSTGAGSRLARHIVPAHVLHRVLRVVLEIARVAPITASHTACEHAVSASQ